MTTPSNTLEGKVAIVTGAASPIGMGRSITTGLVRAGARVAMLDINQDWLDQTANDLRELGGDNAVLPIIADVTDPESVESAVARTIGEMGGLHILVNNAGINPRTGGFTSQGASGSNTGFWNIDPGAWLRVIDVNLSGPFLMSHAVAGHMLEQGYGRIIGVTTSMDTMWRKGGAPYGPSKAGHEALISIMAQDFEGSGVTANVLTPGGATATNMVIAAGRGRPRIADPAGGDAISGSLDCIGSGQPLERTPHHRLPLGRLAAFGRAPGKMQRAGRMAPTWHPVRPPRLVRPGVGR